MFGPDRRALHDLTVLEAVEILGITALAAKVDRLADLIHALKEQNMADFAALNTALDNQAAAITDLKTRSDADMQALRDEIAKLQLDGDDQTNVDAAVARVQANVDALKAIDPVTAPTDGGDGSIPVNPGDGTTPVDGGTPTV